MKFRVFLLCVSLFLTNGLAASAQTAETGIGGVLRVLDKVTGEIVDLELVLGGITTVGRLTIELKDCRYPLSNPSGDAFALISVGYQDDVKPAFEGWLVATAPALNAMDHPRYDIWALRCMTP